MSANEENLAGLLSQRKSYRAAITRAYNQLRSNGTMPSLESAATLQSEYAEITLQLADLNHEDDSDYMEKINLVIDFISLYHSVDRQTSRQTMSLTARNRCQVKIEQLDKLVEKFPTRNGLLDDLHEKLENMSIESTSQSMSSARSNVLSPLAVVTTPSPSISSSFQSVHSDHVSQTANGNPSTIVPGPHVTFGFGNRPTPPIIDTLPNHEDIQSQNGFQNQQPLLQTSPLVSYQQPYFTGNNMFNPQQQPYQVPNNMFNRQQQPYQVPNNIQNEVNPYVSTDIKIKSEEVQKFDGTAANWPDFKDAVEELIINNKQVPTLGSKFRRLMKLLPPLAQKRIRGEKSNPDFQRILNVLDEIYGSPALVMKELGQNIQSLPFLRLDSHHSYFTKFYETMVDIKGIDLNEGDSRTIIGKILGKMDPEHRRRAFHSPSQSITDEKKRIDKLYEYFRQITQDDLLINQMSNIGVNRQQQGNESKFNNKFNRQSDQRKTLAATSSDNGSTSDYKPKCIFCGQFHFHIHCPMSYDQKMLVLNKEKRCYRCAGKGHGTRDCTRIFKCNKCGSNHQSYLCKGTASGSQHPSNQTAVKTLMTSENQPSTSSEQPVQNDETVTSALARSESASQYLQTLTTVINGTKTRVIFDSGSEISFITNKLVNRLNLPRIKNKPICVNGYGGQRGRYIGHYYTTLQLPDRDGSLSEFKLIVDDTVAHFNFNVLPTTVQNQVNDEYNIDFKDENISVDILFGNNDKNRLKCLVADKAYNDSLLIGKTSLGYIVHGRSDDYRSNIVACLSEIHDPPIDMLINPEDERAMQEFINGFIKDGILYDTNERIYRIKFPFISNSVVNSNFNNAKRLLVSKKSSLSNAEFNDYNDLIKELETNKIVVKCNIQPNEGYHMPHSVVVRKLDSEKTTTKKRLVFNASNGNNNLNQAIFKGITTWCLPRSLLHFRLRNIAIIADIKAAFHNVHIQSDHQKYVKFLWYDNNKNDIDCYKFLRLPFGLTSSPFILNVVIDHHIKKYMSKFPEVVAAINSNLYVDDLVHSVNSKAEAIKFHNVSSEIFKDASMELRKWQCSDSDIDNLWSDGLGENKVLGVIWHKNDDTIKISFPLFNFSNDITKRSLLSTLASIYDPMGLLLPSTIQLKFFISELWTRKIDWDDLLPPELHGQARRILTDINKLKSFKLSRKLFNETSTEYDMIIFCDASKKAIGVAVYLSNGVEATYIFGKSKMLKPRKIVTGELLALSAGANLGSALKSMLPINKIIVLSDSKPNVDRLTTDINKFPQCVAVHLYNIRSKIDAVHWVSGKQNPSDALTRGVSFEQHNKLHSLDQKFLEEIYRDSHQFSSLTVKIENPLTINIDVNQSLSYNEWIQLIQQHINDGDDDPLTVLIKLNQQKFLSDLDHFQNTFVDESGIIRCSTRLDNSDLDYDCKNPIFVPNCPFLLSLLYEIHEKVGHGSEYRTMTEFRETYYTPKLRQKAKKVISRCNICRINKAKPLTVPNGIPPASRVTRSVPFNTTGVDMFEIRHPNKLYGLLFTCFVTRAIHLEPVENASASEVLKALRNFAALRNCPSVIFSDNGTNFKKLGKLLNQCLDQIKIEWHFITPYSPHRGGIWESLIKTTKRAMKSIVWKKDLNSENFRTILYEITAIVNSRPIADMNGSILTPNKLIYGTEIRKPPQPPFKSDVKMDLLTEWRSKQRNVNAAWKVWKDLYLKQLRHFQRNKSKYEYLNIGDRVLIKDHYQNREKWPIGEIIETVPDCKGIIRTYRIKIGNDKITRSNRDVFPLEGGKLAA